MHTFIIPAFEGPRQVNLELEVKMAYIPSLRLSQKIKNKKSISNSSLTNIQTFVRVPSPQHIEQECGSKAFASIHEALGSVPSTKLSLKTIFLIKLGLHVAHTKYKLLPN